MLKKVLFATSAILGMSGAAMSADMGMPVKAIAPAYIYDWSGIYLGGVIGGAWDNHDLSDPGLGIVGTILGVPVTQTNKGSGFIGGVEVGSRYQFGKLVVGWEGDVTWGDINNTSTTTNAGPLGAGLISRSLSTSVNWTGTGTATDRYRPQQLAALRKSRRGGGERQLHREFRHCRHSLVRRNRHR